MLLYKSKSNLFGRPKVYTIRNHWLRLIYNTTAQPKCSNLCNAFYGRLFCEPSTRLAVHEGYFWKKGKFWLCYDNLVLLNQRLWLDESGTGTRNRHKSSHVSCFNRGLCTKNTYEHHHHSVCHTTLFPSRLELMVKLTTLLTVFIFTLKAEARDYGKGCYISDSCLCCSASHNALSQCQLANQSRLCLSEGGAL